MVVPLPRGRREIPPDAETRSRVEATRPRRGGGGGGKRDSADLEERRLEIGGNCEDAGDSAPPTCTIRPITKTMATQETMSA